MLANKDVYLDVNKVPEYVWKRLAESAYDLVVTLKSTPEGREMLKREIEEMRKEKRKQ